MSVVSVSRMWSRENAKASISDDRKKRTINYVDAYQVLHSADTTQDEILAHADVPKAGSFLSVGSPVFVRDVSPQRISPIYTIVSVSSSGEFGRNGEHPADIPEPEITWDDVEKDEPIDMDWNGAPIVTANLEPIYGVTEAYPDQTLTVRRAFRFINTYSIRQYRRAVNSDYFYGWPPGTARLRKFSARQVGGEDGGYWMVDAKVQFREPFRTTADKAWYKRVRHEGLYEKVDDKIIRAVDRGGQPVTKPVLLDENGERIFDPNDAYWLLIQTLGSLPYNALGIS